MKVMNIKVIKCEMEISITLMVIVWLINLTNWKHFKFTLKFIAYLHCLISRQWVYRYIWVCD